MCPTYLDALEGDFDGIEREYRELGVLIEKLSRYENATDLAAPLHGLQSTLICMLPTGERERRLPELPRQDAPGQLYLFNRE